MTAESSSGPECGDPEPPADIGGGAALGGVVLIGAAVPVASALMAYAALWLSLEWFPPIDWRHDTQPAWVLPVALYASLVVPAAIARVVARRVTAGLRARHWAFAALLASLLLVALWQRWVRDGATDAREITLGAGVFCALIGLGLWLGGRLPRARPRASRR